MIPKRSRPSGVDVFMPMDSTLDATPRLSSSAAVPMTWEIDRAGPDDFPNGERVAVAQQVKGSPGAPAGRDAFRGRFRR